MSIPTLTKTWQTSFNLRNTPAGTITIDTNNIFLAIKNALKGFSQNPWTVSGSSDSSTANLSGTDLLVTQANIVHAAAGSAHSWIVLRRPTNDQLLIDFNSGPTGESATMTWSPGGVFSGGSTTAAPTATGSIALFASGMWFGNISTNGGQFRAHILHSTDGLNTRVFGCYAGFPAAFWSFEQPTNYPTGWTIPQAAAIVSNGNNLEDQAILALRNWHRGQAKYSSTGPAATMPMKLVAESPLDLSVPDTITIRNEISGTWDHVACGLWHNTTSGQKGFHGIIPDMFWSADALAHGDSFPSDGSKTFTMLGGMLVWTNGENLLLS